MGESLTEDFIRSFISAYVRFSDCKKIAIGTDTRFSRRFVADIVLDELLSNNVNVVWLGIAPTPTVQVITKELGLDGGIVITASHNPTEWNGLKFIRKDGIFLNEAEAGALIKAYESLKNAPPQRKRDKDTLSSFYEEKENARSIHIEKILKRVDSAAIRAKKFKVAMDPGKGAGSKITKELLTLLGCEIISINDDTEKEFQRGPEPVPENLKALEKIVAASKADIGFAQDPDADRLSIVSEEGIAIGEEYTLALAAEFVLSMAKGNVATNLSTSRMIDDIAKKYGVKVMRTKIGEVNVSEKMKETKSVIGGEGNGGVIYPAVGYGRDSIAGIGLILNYLASSNKKVSELVNAIPKYVIIKDRIELSDAGKINSLIKKVKERYSSEKINDMDGIKIDFPDSWVHIRPSNTEPIVRVIAEAKSAEAGNKLISSLKLLQ